MIATCRLRDLGGGQWKLERMVVDRRVRGNGVGGRLLAGAEHEVRERGATEMVLNAQRRAESFYAAHGYRRRGRDVHGGRDRARADAEGARWLSRSRSPRSASISSPACGRSSPPRVRTGPSTSAGFPRSRTTMRAPTARSARAARIAPRRRPGRTGPVAAIPTRPAGVSARSPTSTRRWRRSGRTTRPPRRRAEPRPGRASPPSAIRCAPRRGGGSRISSAPRSATGFHEVIVNSPETPHLARPAR